MERIASDHASNEPQEKPPGEVVNGFNFFWGYEARDYQEGKCEGYNNEEVQYAYKRT
jgi:hypothetical protein